MKGTTEMTFNLNYAELLGRELERDRMREAESERLVRQVSGWNPNPTEKTLIIHRDRWNNIWSRISQMPDKLTSL